MKFRTTHMRSKDSENIGTSGSRMSFEACEWSNLKNSMTFSGFGITKAVLQEHCNSLIFCYLDELPITLHSSYSNSSFFFEHSHFVYYIYNYLYIN
jgi:hypothetical protein